MNKRFVHAILTSLMLGGIVLPAMSTAATIKLGALYPTSGSMAQLGNESLRGVQLAVNEQNAKGGINGKHIDLITVDAVSPSQAVSAAKQLISDHVVAIVGSYSSGLAHAAMPVADLAGVPYFELGAVANSLTRSGYKYVFRTDSDSSEFAKGVLNALHNIIAPKMGLTKDNVRIGIIHEDGPYGTEVAAEEVKDAKKIGYKIVQDLPYPDSVVDMSPLITRMQDAKVNVVLQTSYDVDTVLFFKQAQQAGFRPKVIIGAGGGYSMESNYKATGSLMNLAYDVDFPQDTVNPKGAPRLNTFLHEYESTYKHPPISGHSLANYVGARAVLAILGKAKSTDADAIRTAAMTYHLPPHQTANGWGIDFNKDGQNTLAPTYLMQWQHGKLVTIDPPAVASGKAIFEAPTP